MATGTQTKPELKRLADSAVPAAGTQYVLIINNGSGSSQYPDPNGGTLYFSTQSGSPTIVVTLGGFNYTLQPGNYATPSDPNNLAMSWNLTSGGPIKLAWQPN
jgi:hypothetical protein